MELVRNFSGLLDPQLLRYRLASAAAARHTARHAAAELDVAFCEAAPRMLETKTEPLDEVDRAFGRVGQRKDEIHKCRMYESFFVPKKTNIMQT